MIGFNVVKIEDAAKHITGRAVKEMYREHAGSRRVIMRFQGTEQYLVLPEGVEIINGEIE